MVRKFIVEVVEAHHLMPKDGHGSISPYVQVSFYEQRKNTQTIVCNLNPVWNEMLSFDAPLLPYEGSSKLKLIVYHDQNVCKIRRDKFLGQIELCSTVFVPKGKEVLQYYQLKNSWTRCFQLKMIKEESEIGLKIYYVDEEHPTPSLPPPSRLAPPPPPSPPPSSHLATPPTSLPPRTEEVKPNDVTTPLQEPSREPAPPPPSPPQEIEEVEANDVTTPLQELSPELAPPPPSPLPEIAEVEPNDVTTPLQELETEPKVNVVSEIVEEPPAPQAEPPQEDANTKEEPPTTEGSTNEVNPTIPARCNILRKILDFQNFVGKVCKILW